MSSREKHNQSRVKSYDKQREKELSLQYEFFATEHHRKSSGHTTYHWSVVPEDELFKAGWMHDFNRWRMLKRLKMKEERKIQEYGLDGLSVDREGRYFGLQDKHYLKRNLTAHDLGTFYQTIFMRLKPNDRRNGGYVYYSSQLQGDVRDDSRNAVAKSGEDDTPIRFVRLPFTAYNRKEEVVVDPSTFQLRKYQERALADLLKKDWEGSGLLSMPCGTGKTVILGNYLKEKRYPIVVVLSPTRVLAKQNFDRISCFLKGSKCLLVDCDSDATRDAEEIVEALEKNEFVFLCSTYKSVDVLKEAMEAYRDDPRVFVCVDECHNMNDAVEEFVDGFPRCLQMSATPPAVMDVEVLHQLPFRTAVEKGYITDYEVYIPCVTERTGVEVELKDLDQDHVVRAEFLATGMLRKGCRRCISYHSTKEEAARFNETVRRIFEEYHNEAFVGHVVVDDVPQGERQEILKTFDDVELVGDHYSVISSVRILQEGVDVPLCDSVFIANPPRTVRDSSTRRIVQILNRATRVHANFPSKVARCFVFCDDVHEVASTLQMLKTNDVDFGKKVSYMNGRYDEAGSKEVAEKEAGETRKLDSYVITLKNISSVWPERFEMLQRFVQENGRIPGVKDECDGVLVGVWCAVQRRREKEGKLGKENAYLLQGLNGWYWDVDDAWNIKYEWLIAYVKEFGKCPRFCDLYKEWKVGSWCCVQRTYFKKGLLDEKRRILLESVPGWRWSEHEIWHEWYDLLLEYIKEHGKLPMFDTVYRGQKLGSWCTSQKHNYNKGKLKEEDKDKLEEIDIWTWGSHRLSWDESYAILEKYIQEHHALPKSHESYDGLQLGEWCYVQVKAYKFRKIRPERQKKMEKIQGWKWPSRPEVYVVKKHLSWDESFSLLAKFIEENKRLPKNSETVGDFQAGRWTYTQKRMFRDKKMEKEKIDKLESIPGWDWTIKDPCC